MRKRLLYYRHKPNHRVAAAVYLKLSLRSIVNAVVEVGLRPFSPSDRFCFVAGCGHSGTTLLASKLGLSDSVLLISRESNIFVPSHSLRLSRIIVREWLDFARQEDRAIVVEKSPKHVHALRRIRRLLPESRFIVVVRNPLDTCASLYKRFGDIDFAIERWLMDNRAALKASRQPSTLLVRYEDLTREPEGTLAAVCSFLGIPWDPQLLTRSGSVYNTQADLGPTMTVRKEQVSQRIHDNSSKWRQVLDAAQAASVLQKTAALAAELGYTSDEHQPGTAAT